AASSKACNIKSTNILDLTLTPLCLWNNITCQKSFSINSNNPSSMVGHPWTSIPHYEITLDCALPICYFTLSELVTLFLNIYTLVFATFFLPFSSFIHPQTSFFYLQDTSKQHPTLYLRCPRKSQNKLNSPSQIEKSSPCYGCHVIWTGICCENCIIENRENFQPSEFYAQWHISDIFG
ncbi:hypothetical protein VP01_8705g1, partial [Puccinia sorghi]